MTYENSFWQRLHNYPINKLALKEILDIKDTDLRSDNPKKGYWDKLPINTCTDVDKWSANQKVMMGKKFGDVFIVGRITRPQRKVAFYLSILKKYGDHFTKNLEDFNEDWKRFSKNYSSNRKPTYVFKCVCGRYTKFKIYTVKRLPRELQVCSHCVFMKKNRGDLKVIEYLDIKKEQKLQRIQKKLLQKGK
tara:strand:- start:34 stop:606 length:573 start_codon:yes stop_codon:yes gene_type:complete